MNLNDTGDNNVISVGSNLKETNFRLNILGNGNTVKIGENCKILHSNLTIKGNNASIHIADEVELNGVVLSMFQYCSFSVGALTTMGRGEITIAEETSIDIGEDCMFAHDYEIRTSDMHPIYSLSDAARINHGQSISIGDHVWTGKFISILKGVQIEGNCVVGMNSLVNRSVMEAGVVIAGNPAKMVKRGIVWGRKMYHLTATDDPRLAKYINQAD